jgi:hypothetical protein
MTEDTSPIADPSAMRTFIERWRESGGGETANFQTFTTELCELLGLPKPITKDEVHLNDYSFERSVKFKDDGKSYGRIDL